MRRFRDSLTRLVSGPILLSIVLAFAIGAIFIALAGYSPGGAYAAMLHGSIFSPLGVLNTIQRAIPLVGMAMATAIAFRAGILNIGTEGQMVVGGTVSALVVLYVPGPGICVLFLALIAGFAGGALWGIIAALFQFWPGVPILISSLLLAYPARYLSSWLVRFPFKDPESSMVATRQFDPSTQLPMLVPPKSGLGQSLTSTFGRGTFLPTLLTQVNWGLFIVLAIVVLMLFVNKRTVFGYESGISGLNARFAQYGGANARALTFSTMAISGGVAGLIGTIFVIGAPNTRLIEGAIVSTNYAWTGLLVALLAMYRPASVLVAGIFFGAIMAGSGAMSRELGMSPQIAAVVQGLVIILVAFHVGWPKLRKRITAKEGEPRE
ncbi:ABC transporter permease [Trueperella sp. LYQ143]|uniref:ABC transporter permease n=1 Tax=unclassified Trueperella TaxID=2630174 RepID=UPI003982F7A3